MKLYFDFPAQPLKLLKYILLSLFFLIPSLSNAQTFSISSNYIEILGSGTTGIFGLGTSPTYTLPSASIMFCFPLPGCTSYITSWVNGTDYDYGGGAIVNPMTSSGSGLGAFIEMTKTVVAGLQLKVHYEIVNNPQTGLLPDTALLEFVYTNVGATSFTLGHRVELDTDINGHDGANISINNGVSTVPVNTMYRISDGDMVPEWWGYDIPPPGIANLVATGSIYNNPFDLPATEPDAFEVSWWPSVTGGGVWTIGPVGDPITDSAVVYWWTGGGNETVGTYVLNAGQSKTFLTYVGLNQIALLSTPTNTPTNTPAVSSTFTNTPTITSTPTLTPTPTNTFTPTITLTPTVTPTPTITNTPTITPTPTNTATVTNTFTPTNTATATCEVHAWPDPYNANYAWNGFFQLSCLQANDTVSFFTVSGELVKKMTSSGAMVQWDGLNTNKARVSTGIYFWAIQRDGKTVLTGKFLIVK